MHLKGTHESVYDEELTKYEGARNKKNYKKIKHDAFYAKPSATMVNEGEKAGKPPQALFQQKKQKIKPAPGVVHLGAKYN